MSAYDFSTLKVSTDGTTERGAYKGVDTGNQLIGLKDAFAKAQDDVNTKADAAFKLMSENPSNLTYVASFTTCNAAMMNVFGAQSGVVKSIGDKIDQLLRNIAS